MMKNIKLDKNNKIGEGWQYRVYDLGNGRVYKKFNSWSESFRSIFWERWFVFWKIPSFIKDMRNNAIKSFEFLDKSHIDKALFGNVTIVNKLDFEQDKVISLKEYFITHSLVDNKKVIDDFIELCQIFLERGFIDKSMKIGKNFGINNEGKVILIDIGEIWFKKDEIKKRIKKRTWAVSGNYKEVPTVLQKYYLHAMDELFLNTKFN